MGASTTNQDQTQRIRLHISPFNESLVSSVLNPRLTPSASNISFHTLQTFPERNYGFVDLSATEGKKLKNKLHGSILKGVQLRVEEARPSRIGSEEGRNRNEEGDKCTRRIRYRRSSNPSYATGRAIAGLRLPDHRRVQRGWTKPSSSIRRSDSKKSKDQPLPIQTITTTAAATPSTSLHHGTSQCLFRVRLPANRTSISTTSRSTKDGKMGKRRVQHDQRTVVREFSSTTKSSTFLRDENVDKKGKPVSQYVDGKGWVDEDGGVVEGVSGSVKGRMPGLRQETRKRPSSRRSESKDQPEKPHETPQASPVDDLEAEVVSIPAEKTPLTSSRRTSRTGRSKGSAEGQESPRKKSVHSSGHRTGPGLSITIPGEVTVSQPGNTTAGSSKEVHPLESIFKKSVLPGHVNATTTTTMTATPKTTIESKEQPFSFFGHIDDDDDDSKEEGERNRKRTEGVNLISAVPPTPFTQQDFQHRVLRSAAPTPDTAAPGKRFSFSWRRDDEDATVNDDDDDEDADDDEEDDGDEHRQRSTPVEPRKTNGFTPPSSNQVIEWNNTSANHDDHDIIMKEGGDRDHDRHPPTNDNHNNHHDENQKPFEDRFWDERANTNRIWRRRKRETGKVRRRLENKRLARRS